MASYFPAYLQFLDSLAEQVLATEGLGKLH
jgi:hypothetical protein